MKKFLLLTALLSSSPASAMFIQALKSNYAMRKEALDNINKISTRIACINQQLGEIKNPNAEIPQKIALYKARNQATQELIYAKNHLREEKNVNTVAWYGVSLLSGIGTGIVDGIDFFVSPERFDNGIMLYMMQQPFAITAACLAYGMTYHLRSAYLNRQIMRGLVPQRDSTEQIIDKLTIIDQRNQIEALRNKLLTHQ